MSSNELSSDKSFSGVQDEIANVSLSEPLSSCNPFRIQAVI